MCRPPLPTLPSSWSSCSNPPPNPSHPDLNPRQPGAAAMLQVCRSYLLCPAPLSPNLLAVEAKRGGGMEGDGEEGQQQPHLVLVHKLFMLSHPNVNDLTKVDIHADVLAAVKSDDMASLYDSLAADGVLEMDAGLLAEMRIRIDEEVRKLDEKRSNLWGFQQFQLSKMACYFICWTDMKQNIDGEGLNKVKVN